MTRTLHYGDFGPDVGDVQQKLVEFGVALRPIELATASIGDSTRDAVREFQRSQGLADDGVVGARTLYALEHPRSSSSFAPGWRLDKTQIPAGLIVVVEAAVGDVGLKEDPDGSNDGPDLKKFNTSGAAWCAVALYHWFKFHEGGAPWTRTASTWAFYQWAKKHKRIVPKYAIVRPGDVWYVYRKPPVPDDTPRGHVALIVTANSTSRFSCVGGNESNRVRGSVRARENATDIIRPVGLI